MKKIMLLLALVATVALVGCNQSEDNGKVYQPDCDKSDPTCKELYNDGMGAE